MYSFAHLALVIIQMIYWLINSEMSTGSRIWDERQFANSRLKKKPLLLLSKVETHYPNSYNTNQESLEPLESLPHNHSDEQSMKLW